MSTTNAPETFTLTDEDGGVSSHTYTGRHAQFVRDMIGAGIPWRHYAGRFYPSDWNRQQDRHSSISVQDIHRATKVRCQQDGMGLDFVLYPA